ncbi:MAG: family 16 glycoside hydrolase [Planctomycetota bacterium]
MSTFGQTVNTADSTADVGPLTQDQDEENGIGKAWVPMRGKWDIARFGGEGPTEIDDNLIKLGFGDPLTGVRWTGDFPTDNFEIRLQARRTDGFDFFVALTFPVGMTTTRSLSSRKQPCVSFVLGGWGGGVTGISSIDGQDASSNETTVFDGYDNDRWYKVRVRVDDQKIMAWVDDEETVDVDRENKKFDIRAEMDPTLPVGIANFQCYSEIRGIEYRRLTEIEDSESSTSVGDAKRDNQPNANSLDE